ncbi:MAG: hypothetical protein ACREMS_08710 [Gemmatimonadaceae bacterium]
MIKVFAPKLLEDDLCDFLGSLNTLTNHRFTGIYRFEPGWVVSVALFDRENPDLRIGADVKMKESYCWLTGLGGITYVIEDACNDPRLSSHPARDEVRSYVAVLLRDRKGEAWGTLCHFDFAPRQVDLQTRIHLEFFRPLVEEMFVRDKPALWQPDAPSIHRATRIVGVEQGQTQLRP